MSNALPHCRAPDACAPKEPGRHCAACSRWRLTHDPEIKAKRLAGIAAMMGDPLRAARRVRQLTAASRAYCQSDEGKRRRSEIGRATFHQRLTAETRARSHSPEARRKAGRSCVETKLAWCPVEYRTEYFRLLRSKRMRSADARRVIEDQIEADRRRYERTGQLQRTTASTYEETMNG